MHIGLFYLPVSVFKTFNQNLQPVLVLTLRGVNKKRICLFKDPGLTSLSRFNLENFLKANTQLWLSGSKEFYKFPKKYMYTTEYYQRNGKI